MNRPRSSMQTWERRNLYVSKYWEHKFYLDLGKDGRESEHSVTLYYLEKGSSVNLVLYSDDKFMHAYSGHFLKLEGQFNTQLTLPEDGYLDVGMSGWVFDTTKSGDINELLSKLSNSNLDHDVGEYSPAVVEKQTGKDTWKLMMETLGYVEKLSIEEIYSTETDVGTMISGKPKDVDNLKKNYGKEVATIMTGTKKISVCVAKKKLEEESTQ